MFSLRALPEFKIWGIAIKTFSFIGDAQQRPVSQKSRGNLLSESGVVLVLNGEWANECKY